MSDDLLAYYERELTFLRQLGAEFAEKYPKIAGRLILEPDKCEDPHVERLMEAFAFLAARIHRKLDDELPEVTESLLSVLYPHYLAPVPSMSIVQFLLDPAQARLQTGQTIPRESTLASRPVDGVPCRFRTCYPVTVWPVELVAANFEAPARVGPVVDATRTILRLQLKVIDGLPFADLRQKISPTEVRPFERLRFFLQGEGQVVYELYELLFNNLIRLELRSAKTRNPPAPAVLPTGCLKPVGFARDEGMLPYTDRSFMGYRLLQELFSFPEKFLFFDLCDLNRAGRVGESDTVEVWLSFNREFAYEKTVNTQTFRLNCTPVTNLFRQVAEPIQLTHTRHEYRVVPDVRRQMATEVYSVDEVVCISPHLEKPVPLRPFYSYKHAVHQKEERSFWHASRRASERKDDAGTEVYLTLMDLDFNPSLPGIDTLTVRTTCTNRDLPSRLAFGAREGDFQLEGPGIFQSIRCLKKPTPTLRPSLRRGAHWRLISHLSLNYLSLLQSEEGRGPEALQEILKLYDFADSSATRRQIAGITAVSARRVFRVVGSALRTGFTRGVEISLELDEQQYVGTGVFLFAAVLEHFFALYSSINSFTQLVLTTQQREGVVHRWPPKAGEQLVL
jgi:type VI secretion system protein ImpG